MIWLPEVLNQPGAAPPPAPGLPSTTEASEMLIVGSGAVSSLVMVPIAVPSAMVAPLGDDSVSVRVSLASTAVSPLTCT